MKRKKAVLALGILIGVLAIAMAGCYYYVRSAAFMDRAAELLQTKASDVLGTETAIGSIQVKSLHEVELTDLDLYDKQAESIAHAERARVSFRLLSAWKDAEELLKNPADAIDTVEVENVTANLTQRDDGTWNVQDIQTSGSGEMKFHGKVKLLHATVALRAQGIEETADGVNASLDFADDPVIRAQAEGTTREAPFQVKGTISKDKQIVSLKAQHIDIAPYLGYIPSGTLPDGVRIEGGAIRTAELQVYRRSGAPVSVHGSADFIDGEAQVEQTTVEQIHGHADFDNQEVLLSADAEAALQRAHVAGRIRLDASEPHFDLTASSDSFDPSAVLANIPYRGAAKFTVRIKGTASQPMIDGNVEAAEGAVQDIAFKNARAKVRFLYGRLYLQRVYAEAFGGTLTGEGEVTTGTQEFTAHVKTQNVDIADAMSALPQLGSFPVSGKLTADLGLHGVGMDTSRLTAYGSVSMRDGSYADLPVERMHTSFYLDGHDLTIDYLSAWLPHQSSLGLEGSIRGGRDLDLAIYGGYVDLSLVQKLVPQAEMTGFGDFEGTVQGDLANPQVEVSFSAMHGKFFKQPYDTLKIRAGGSLDGVHVDDFLLEKDGQQTWFVQGTVGFAGEKTLNLRIDTKGARMEDVAALVAPDRPITGNVDNVIQLTGTLDNPEGVGYVHFYRGSYAGVLLSGMDGDYFLHDGVVRLQDFHLFSPMIDVVLNGTIDRQWNLDLRTEARDLDMERFKSKLPYPVSGKGAFEGNVKGTIQEPAFYGHLRAPEIVLNGQSIRNLDGWVKYEGDILHIDHFGFQQNTGTWNLEASYDAKTQALSGHAAIENADVNALTAMLNLKNDKVQGKMNASVEIGGSLENPSGALQGSVAAGTAAGYDIHDVKIGASLKDHQLTIDTLEGKQGSDGSFEGKGSVDLSENGAVKGNFSAQGISVGMLTALGGIQTEVIGETDVEASLGGYRSSPTVDATIRARDGGVRGATFDALNGLVHLKRGILDIESLTVQKHVADQTYQMSAEGVVPFQPLLAKDASDLNDLGQMHLEVSLDHADLSLLPALTNQIDWAIGATTGKLTITGTPAHPLVNGSVGVADGAMKLKVLEKPITNMKLSAEFRGNSMTIGDFHGKMGEGTFHGSGSLTLDGLKPSTYDFDFQTDQLDVESSFFRGPITASFHLGQGEMPGGRKLPKLSGKIDFCDCMVSVPSIPDGDSMLPDAMLDVQVNVGDKVHFYSSYLYDMYLTGSAHFGGTTLHPRSSGTISVRRGGTVSYLKTPFVIQEGTAYFNQVDSFLPSIRFLAETRLTQAKVRLALTGPLSDMQISLTSEPAMSQTEIIQLLTLRNAYRAGKQIDAGDLLTAGLQASFLAEVEGVMRKMLWLDDFTISRGSGSMLENHHPSSQDSRDEVYNVEMGKYIGDKLLVRYTQGIGDDTKRYGVRYDLSDRYGLTFDQESGDSRYGVQIRVSF